MMKARTHHDLLREFRDEGDVANAARYLRFLVELSRSEVRRYPDPRTKDPGKSGDWQVTRSHALRALREGRGLEEHAILDLHLRFAFTEAEGGETLEDRQARAIETFEACLDAAKAMAEPEEDPRNFFRGVDFAADYALEVMEREHRFPPKSEVRKATENATGLKFSVEGDWPKIYRHAYLTFLPK